MDEKMSILWTQTFTWASGDKLELISTKQYLGDKYEYIVNVTIAYKTKLQFTYQNEGDACIKFQEYKAWFFDKHLVKGKITNVQTRK